MIYSKFKTIKESLSFKAFNSYLQYSFTKQTLKQSNDNFYVYSFINKCFKITSNLLGYGICFTTG